MLLIRRNNERNWMQNFFDDVFDTDLMPRLNGTAPAVNVKEDEKSYTMQIAAPGLKKEWCRVTLDEDGNLDVVIENKMEHKKEDKKERYLRREFSYSNYEQRYELPENVDKQKIAARVNDGVLTVELPKLSRNEEQQQHRAIEVK